MTILRPYSSLARALVATAIFTIAPWSAVAQIKVLDQVVAIVDDDIILTSELQDRVVSVRSAMESRGVPEDAIVRNLID